MVLDVSTGGLGFRAVDPLGTDQWLPFRLSVPGLCDINLSGRVVWLDDTRKRGGLCVVVPVAERQGFQLWQQQYLVPSPEAEKPVSSPREPDSESLQTIETRESRVTRNVLAGCLVLALCIAVAGGSRFLATTTHPITDLLRHLGRSRSVTKTQASAAAASRNTTRGPQNAPAGVAPGAAARAPHSRVAHNRPANRYDARLSTRAATRSPSRQLQSHAAHPMGSAASAHTPTIGSRSPPRLIAEISAASANRAMSEERRIPNPFSRSLNARPLPAQLTTVAGPSVAKSLENANGNSPAAAPTAAPSAIQIPEALKSQTLEPTPSLKLCQLISSVRPAYPKDAKKRRIEGNVTLRVVVGTDGTVKNVVPLGGPSLLVGAAVDATLRPVLPTSRKYSRICYRESVVVCKVKRFRRQSGCSQPEGELRAGSCGPAAHPRVAKALRLPACLPETPVE